MRSLTPAPFIIEKPGTASVPVVYNSPHSGDYYGSDFLQQSVLDLPEIRWSEDAYVDQVVGSMPLAGAHLFKAVYPRAYVDVNREAFELDPNMFDAPLPHQMSCRSARAFSSVARFCCNWPSACSSCVL